MVWASRDTIKQYDYCLNSETVLLPGIWMYFLDTEEAHAVMLASGADEGGLPWRDDTGI